MLSIGDQIGSPYVSYPLLFAWHVGLDQHWREEDHYLYLLDLLSDGDQIHSHCFSCFLLFACHVGLDQHWREEDHYLC